MTTGETGLEEETPEDTSSKDVEQGNRGPATRASVWRYTVSMVFVGGLISTIFFLGAAGSLAEKNYPMAAGLVLVALAFISFPAAFLHCSLSSLAERMAAREMGQEERNSDD